jgi:hypothetical protein
MRLDILPGGFLGPFDVPRGLSFDLYYPGNHSVHADRPSQREKGLKKLFFFNNSIGMRLTDVNEIIVKTMEMLEKDSGDIASKHQS